MKKLMLIISIIFAAQFSANSQTAFLISNNEVIDCAELESALFLYKTVCLVKRNPNIWEYNITLDDCNLVLEAGQELLIPSVTNLRLINGSDITLQGDAVISGEHFETSRIIIGSEGNLPPTNNTAVNMESCIGCSISEVTITSETNETNDLNTIGVVIDNESSDNNMSAINVENVDSGIIVNGNNNTFNDLHFFNVASDIGNCDANTTDTDAAMILNSSSHNEITNILHIRSPAAITMWLAGECNANTILNISVEQEDTFCTNDDFDDMDPSLYIDNLLSSNNIITCNFNHGKTTVPDENIICQNNNISDLDNCNEVAIGINCGNN